MRRCRQTVADPSLSLLQAWNIPSHLFHLWRMPGSHPSGRCTLSWSRSSSLRRVPASSPPRISTFWQPAPTPPVKPFSPHASPPDSISDSAWQGWCSPPPSNQVPCTSPIGLTDAAVIPAWRVLATRPPAGRNSRLHSIDATPAPIIQPIAWPRLGRLVRFWQCPLLLPSSALGRSVLDHHTRRRHSLVASGGRRSRGASVIGGQSLPDAVASGRKRTKARHRFLSLHLPPMPTPCPFSVCRAGKPFPSWCASTLRGLTIMSWKDHGTSAPAKFDKNKLN